MNTVKAAVLLILPVALVSCGVVEEQHLGGCPRDCEPGCLRSSRRRVTSRSRSRAIGTTFPRKALRAWPRWLRDPRVQALQFGSVAADAMARS